MTTVQDTTVAEIAAASLAAVRVFEGLGIDYCCGGKRPLADICRDKGIALDGVLQQLEAAAAVPAAADRDWNTAPLRDLVEHILRTHHDYLRREFEPLGARVEKVERKYTERYGPTFTGLTAVFGELRAELEMHMHKEELILFPVIAALDGGTRPKTCFATIAAPIGVMEAEHTSAGNALERIREITNNFAIPDYACATFRAAVAGLQELERDLHQHIHLENNILFPRALALEAARAAGA